MLILGTFRTGAGRALVLSVGLLLTGCGLAPMLGPSWPQIAVLAVFAVLAAGAGSAAVIIGLRAQPLLGLAMAILSLVLPWIALRAATDPGVISPRVAHVLVASGVACIAAFVLLSLQSRGPATNTYDHESAAASPPAARTPKGRP